MKSATMSATPEIGELIQREQATIWRYLRYLGCDPSLADDLTQETILKILENPPAAFDPAGATAYYRTVARNLFLKSLRHPPFENLGEADAVWERYSGKDGGEAYREALRGCIELLDARAREALRLRYREGASREEMAQALGMTPEGLKTLIRRVKERLKECIERKLRRE